ncbi:MAG: HD domain-containing phosphohydrolase [Candidatus Omnitrophota bacterium]
MMQDINKAYKDEFLKRLTQSAVFKEEQDAFNNVIGKANWLLFASDDKRLIQKRLQEAVVTAKKTKKPVVFRTGESHSACLTIGRGDSIYGYLLISPVKSKIDDHILNLLASYTNTVIEEINKEIELSKLYEVIRPRAIALSTIHTVHRLIGSTLVIDELLPRIARLALQVLRAEKAAIYMKDIQTNKLKCVTEVNFAKTKDFFKIGKSHSLLAQRIATTFRSVLKNDTLAVPLIEEDVIGVIIVRYRIDKKSFTIFDQEILTTLAEQAVIAVRNAQLYKEQQDITTGSIKSLASVLDLKLPGVYTHTTLFVELMLALGKELKLNQDQMHNLHYSALLPDLGKVFLPERILKKPSPLDKKERSLIMMHTEKAVEIMQHLSGLKSTIPIILHHHERHDGKGYPYQLKGDQIPIGARIMAVGDAFEAMLRRRFHRKQLTLPKVVSEIESQSGRQFDPKVVDAFMKLYKDGRLDNLVKGHKNELEKVF